MNRHGIFNVVVDATVAIGFTLAAVSGVCFLFVPGSGGAVDPLFIFSRTTWDLIHTWSGVAMIIAAVIHFVIHWNWVTKVTAKVFRSLSPAGKPAAQRPVAGSAEA